jgi:5'(3')-deoxyribonucleotidase
MKRKVIAVDIDDVLSLTAEGFAAFSDERWGGKHKSEDYTEAWAEFWNVSIEEALKRSDEYHDSGVIATFNHHGTSVGVLRRLSKKYDIVVITSRRKTLKDLTDTWLATHYPGIFSEVHYAGIWDHDGEARSIEHRLNQTKTELAQQIGADYLIDDQPKHCVSAAAVGIQALLFGRHKSLDMLELPAGVIRVADWIAVEEYFDAKG